MSRFRDRYGRFMAKTAPAREVVKRNAWPWFLWAAMAALVIGWIAPHQIGVLTYNVCKLTLGAFFGYWVDHNIFWGARPEEMPLDSPATTQANYRRAGVVCVGMLTMGVSA